jgi:molybdate transport system ATP-binding protein
MSDPDNFILSMTDSSISAQLNLRKGNFTLDVELSLPAAGVTVLFGRSGCGKTTLLRALAGLEKPQGVLHFREQVWQDTKSFLPTHQRPIAYVFQEASLFAHLDVRANLEFGYQRIPLSQRRITFDDAVQLLGVDTLLQRKTQQLSGGERQRVAIARALLTSPQWILMDEPLASLDAESKADILPYLEHLRHQLAIPILYITHSIDEMLRLADYLVLMDAGRIRASGAPNGLLTNPDLPLAYLDEAAAIMDAVILSHDDRYYLTTVQVPGGVLTTTRSHLPVGSATRVRILARDVSITLSPPQHSSILNCLQTQVLDITPDHNPARVLVRLALSSDNKNNAAPELFCILARITRRSADQLALSAGMTVYAQIKAVALMV